MRIAIRRNTTTVELDIYHITDSAEQLEAVFHKLHVASLPFGEFLVVLLFHIGCCFVEKVLQASAKGNLVPYLPSAAKSYTKLGMEAPNRHCKSCQNSCTIGHSAFCPSCTIGHFVLITDCV